jgi:hypothetical protein
MQLIIAIQRLRRHRLPVAFVLLLSAAVGILLVYRVSPGLPPHLQSKRYTVGVANARVLVNTPNSIIADLNPSGAASLSQHAQLLADLFASEPIRAAIAREAGIPVESLSVIPPAVAGAPVQTPLATATVPLRQQATLTMGVDSTLPLVSISAQAPDETKANELADGAVRAIQGYLRSVATSQNIPVSRQPVIQALGGQSGTLVAGPSRVLGALAVIIVFGLGCYVILFVDGIRRRLRESAAETDALAVNALDAPNYVDEDADEDLRAVFQMPPPVRAPVPASGDRDPRLRTVTQTPGGPDPVSRVDGVPAMVGSSRDAAEPINRQAAPTADTVVHRSPDRGGWTRPSLNGLLGRR